MWVQKGPSRSARWSDLQQPAIGPASFLGLVHRASPCRQLTLGCWGLRPSRALQLPSTTPSFAIEPARGCLYYCLLALRACLPGFSAPAFCIISSRHDDLDESPSLASRCSDIPSISHQTQASFAPNPLPAVHPNSHAPPPLRLILHHVEQVNRHICRLEQLQGRRKSPPPH